MRTVRSLPVVALVLLGLALLFRKDADGENRVEHADIPPSAVPAPSVKVEHTLVTVDVMTSPAVQPRRSAPPASTAPLAGLRVSASSSALQVKAEPTGLASRARRAIVGDGRHKPQPFPRIDNNK